MSVASALVAAALAVGLQLAEAESTEVQTDSNELQQPSSKQATDNIALHGQSHAHKKRTTSTQSTQRTTAPKYTSTAILVLLLLLLP